MKICHRRREFLTSLVGVTASIATLRAQEAITKTSRIGWLATGSPASYQFSLSAFREGLKAFGYVEGQNLVIEYRWAEGDVDRLAPLAKELLQHDVDVILAGGSAGAEAATRATSKVPIVAAGIGDLVELGLVPSLARPGGNLTGFVAVPVGTAAKRFQIMKEIEPEAKLAVILGNLTASWAKRELEIVNAFAASNGIAIVLQEARKFEELKRALADIPRSNPDFLVVLNDPFIFTYRKTITEAISQLRIPAIYGFREFVDDGGLISYGASIRDTYRRAAEYVDKILKGTKPADLPVQLPSKFELVINLGLFKSLGLKVPSILLALADELIN